MIKVIYESDDSSCEEERQAVEEAIASIESMLNGALRAARKPKTCSGRNFMLLMVPVLRAMMCGVRGEKYEPGTFI